MEKLGKWISLATRIIGLALLIMVTAHVAVSLQNGQLCHIGGDVGVSASGFRGFKVSGDVGARVSGDVGARVSGDVGVLGDVGIIGDVGVSASGFRGFKVSGDVGVSGLITTLDE